MANNYEAIVRAVLDQTQFNTDMGKLQNERFDLRNIHVDPSNLATEIQRALNSSSFNINVNPILNPSNSRQTTNNLAASIETALRTNISNRQVNVDLSDVLRIRGVDQPIADRVLASFNKDIDTTKIALRSLDVKFKETATHGKVLESVKITGIDEDGKVISAITRLDKKTNSFSTTVTNVSQKFAVATKAADNTQEAFKRLLSVQKEIGSVEFDLEKSGLNQDSKHVEELQRQLRNLQAEYAGLYSQIGANLSSKQRNQLSDEAEKATKKIRELRSSVQDDIELKISTQKIDADISSVTRRINDLKTVGNGDIIDLGLEDDLAELQRLRSLMDNQSGSQLKNTYSDFSSLLDTIKNKLTIISNENKNVVSSLQVATLDNKMKTWLEKNTKASKEFGAVVENLRKQLGSLDTSSKDAASQLDKIEREFKEVQQAAIAAGKTGKSFGDTLKKTLATFTGFFTVEAIFDRIVDCLRDMYQAVYDIDTAMVSLMKVTDETSSRYNAFLDDAAASAKELGRSVSSLIEQSATWAKLGYTLDQAEELAKLSSIYANVAEVDDSTAVSDMVTAMKAFNIEAEKAVTVIDPLNELGNTFATDAAALGDALSKSASAMNAAGTDMYKTLAMITGGAEITQNAGEFGNFLKVASMRIRGMKGELEELGEEVDESVDSISKVQTQILNLTHGEVNIFDDMGEFRDYYEIMEDISEVYEKLSSTEQASLAEILFGKMRGNQGQALLQAFQSGQIQKAYETALSSAGSVAAEQEKWMEGLEAKAQRFKAAWQELSMTVLNSDFLKGLIDSGTVLLEILTKIVEAGAAIPLIFDGVGIISFVKNLD